MAAWWDEGSYLTYLVHARTSYEPIEMVSRRTPGGIFTPVRALVGLPVVGHHFTNRTTAESVMVLVLIAVLSELGMAHDDGSA